ncbi:vespryn-21-like [Pleurodeles waltl]|uniref:vespryn-21-like n=1 Tax=Pleurodeles waltl TaxID=8319 RepID=UPI00370952B4
MMTNSLFLCFLIGSILQSSLCEDNNTTNTAAGNYGKVTETSGTATETNGTGYGNQNQGCGSTKEGTKNNCKEEGSQDQDVSKTDGGSSFVAVENVRQYKENVILDSKTAHPLLYLSADLKNVSLGSTKQNLDNNTERFDSDPCVLGTTGYTNGKHYFEAEGDAGVLVGFAATSVPRKGPLDLSTDAGIFAHPRAKGDSPDVVGSLLDCDQGQVLFYDASTNTVVSNLVLPNGCNEEMRPFIFLGVGEIKVS